jgi:hypothetical protein
MSNIPAGKTYTYKGAGTDANEYLANADYWGGNFPEHGRICLPEPG